MAFHSITVGAVLFLAASEIFPEPEQALKAAVIEDRLKTL